MKSFSTELGTANSVAKLREVRTLAPSLRRRLTSSASISGFSGSYIIIENPRSRTRLCFPTRILSSRLEFLSYRRLNMLGKDPIWIYVFVLSCFFLAFLITRAYTRLRHQRVWILRYLLRLLAHRKILRRHTLMGPWALLPLIIGIVVTACNCLCLIFGPGRLATRSGWLSLVNLVLLYASANLSYTSDCIGWSLKSTLLLHRTLGWLSSILVAAHVLSIRIETGSIQLDGLRNIIVFTV